MRKTMGMIQHNKNFYGHLIHQMLYSSTHQENCKTQTQETPLSLPDTDMEGAKILAERLRVGLKTKSILDAITVSIGIGCFTPREDAKDKPLHNVDKISEHLIKRADDAVYRAKHLGRNRVCLSETLYQSKEFDMTDIRLRVLLIEPNVDDSAKYAHHFRVEGYVISCSTTAKDGMKLFIKDKPQVVLVDAEDLDVDVAEFFKELRADNQEVPIGVMTTHTERKQEMLDIGIQRFFGKPVPLTEIEEWLSYMTKR